MTSESRLLPSRRILLVGIVEDFIKAMPENSSMMTVGGKTIHKLEYNHYSETTIFANPFRLVEILMSGLSWLENAWLILLFIVLGIGFLINPLPALIVVCLLFAVLGLVFMGAARLSKGKVRATEDGIELPDVFVWTMGRRRTRRWSELKRIMYCDEGLISTTPTEICLVFSDGKYASFYMDGFSKENLESFVMLVKSYCPDVEEKPAPSELETEIKLEAREGNSSFTALWQQELDMRFGSTAFVPLEQGDRLQDGLYEILGQIAFGGLSAVYLARHKEIGPCVIKEAVLPDSSDEETRQKALSLFQREAKLLSKIDHERIACVYDYFVEEGRHYMVVEHIDGKNMREFVTEFGPQSPEAVVRWAQEAAEILEYLHNLVPPIVHRDFTPDNMLLEKDGSITVIDFGAANNFVGTATGTVIGKTSYIPVEQFRGKATPQSDLYSFGCTLYFLLTGKDPDPLSLGENLESSDTIPGDLLELIRDCTAMETADRIKGAGDCLRVLGKRAANE